MTRPIKGTRPRGRDKVEDDRLRDELLASEKDRAELTMIVDLERNDLGRVCEFGTVKVTEPLKIETYAQVHHLVATVEGRARRGLGQIDWIRAVSGRIDHRCAEDQGDGDHRRVGADAPRFLHRRDWLFRIWHRRSISSLEV